MIVAFDLRSVVQLPQSGLVYQRTVRMHACSLLGGSIHREKTGRTWSLDDARIAVRFFVAFVFLCGIWEIKTASLDSSLFERTATQP